jgi:hypothetical protein
VLAGLPEELARELTAHLPAHDALGTHAEAELASILMR